LLAPARAVPARLAPTLLAPALQDALEIHPQQGEAMGDKNQGEGNREADRRYREGVRKTVEHTTDEERAEDARDLTPEERDAAQRAEKEGKSRARR
jgi:hypothetical protein